MSFGGCRGHHHDSTACLCCTAIVCPWQPECEENHAMQLYVCYIFPITALSTSPKYQKEAKSDLDSHESFQAV